ncbi:MAG: ATP-binding protein [Lachnospiraceae bacterium]|nr:ATP-binding protein [Lachnospiraceae bacterium]
MPVIGIDKRDLTKVEKPKSSQDIIPIKQIYESGMCRHNGHRYSMCYELKDVDFSSLSDDGKEVIFGTWSEVLHSLDGSGNLGKITICNRHKNKRKILNNTLLDTNYCDGYDNLRLAANRLRVNDVQGDNGFVQDKFITIAAYKPSEEKAENYFRRLGKDINKRLDDFDSGIKPLKASQRMEVIYNFFRPGRESEYNYQYAPKNAKGKFKDYICPDGIDFKYDHFIMGDKVGRVMMLKTLGTNIKDDFLTRLAEIKTNLVLTADIIALTNAEARRLIDLKDDDVETNAHAWSSKKAIREGSAIRLPRQVSKDRKVIDAYIADMDENNQKMFLMQILVVFLADNMDLLDEYTDSIRETAAEYTSQMSVLYFQQRKGLQDALPFGVRTINYLRDCNTDTTAIMIPFNAVNIDHSTGIPYGRHEGTGQQQMVDRRLLNNGHEWVLGPPGSGKSTNVKLKIIFETLFTDGDLIILDPDGEYTPLVNAIGGQVIRVGIDNINICDITRDYGDDVDPIKKKSNFIISFFDAILDERTSFSDAEKSLVDRIVRGLLQPVLDGIYPSTSLVEIYEALVNCETPTATKLAEALERHIKGSFNSFAQPTNVEYMSRIVCYDLSHLQEQEKNAGMLVVLDHIDSRLISNRAKDRITYIKIEEASYFLQHYMSCLILKNFFLRARKYGGLITAIIQNVSMVLQNKVAKEMLGSAETVVMMRQFQEDAEILAEMYGLSSNQVRSLVRAEKGHGINKIGNIIYAFDGTIPEDNEILKLVDTNVGKPKAS